MLVRLALQLYTCMSALEDVGEREWRMGSESSEDSWMSGVPPVFEECVCNAVDLNSVSAIVTQPCVSAIKGMHIEVLILICCTCLRN